MNPARQQLSDNDLQLRKATFRRGMLRANRAAMLVLIVVIGLALAAIFKAYQADRSAYAATESSQRAEQQRARAEQELWKSYLAQAQLGRAGGQMGRRFQALDAVARAARMRPSLELRDEAIALLALTDLKEERWIEHSSDILNVAFDSELERCALGDREGGIRVIQLDDQQQLLRLSAKFPAVYAFQFSPDGQYLAAVYLHGQLVVWKLADATVAFEANMGTNGSPQAFDFTPDSKRIAFGHESGLISLHDLATGARIDAFMSETAPSTIRWHPFSPILAIATSNMVQTLDMQQRQIKYRLDHADEIFALDWHPSGDCLAAACANGDVYLWHFPSCRSRILQGHTSSAAFVAFNRQGDILCSTGYDGTCRFWDTTSYKQLFSTHRGYGRQFSSNGARLAFMRPKEGIGVWKVVAGAGYQSIPILDGPERNIWSADISPDEQYLAAIKADGLRIVELKNEKLAASVPIPDARTAYFLPNGKSVITSQASGVDIWSINPESDSNPGAVSVKLERHLVTADGEAFHKAQLSKDGQLLAVGVGRYAALLLRLENPSSRVWFFDTNYFNRGSVTVSPDGQWVATGTFHGSGARVWDAKTGEPVRDLGGRSAEVAFSPDGKCLAAGASNEYIFWETGTWNLIRRIPRDTIGELTGYVAFAQDGSTMAIAKSHRLVQLINSSNGRQIASLAAPDSQVITSLRFSLSGNLLAVGTSVGIVQLWDLRTIRQELLALNLGWDSAGDDATLAAALPFNPIDSTPAAKYQSGFEVFISLALGGVVLAVVCAVFTLHRHRKLIESYEQIDELVIQRDKELAAAQADVLHSQKMRALGALAAGIAHDFNNLLSIIRMANKLTGRETQDNPDVQDNVSTIEQAVNQGKLVVRSMLGYSREAPDTIETFTMAELVEDTVALLSKQFLSGIALTLELDPGAPSVSGSRGRLEQVLLNLIVNASEAMDRKGRLLIAIRSTSGLDDALILRPWAASQYVELIVADSGPGIDAEILPRIFEPFFTTKKTGTTRGTGLGLSMVYTIAREDGLGISIQTAPGNGASFRIILPAD